MHIKSQISDGDLKLQGVDGGSLVTALTLDMSAAGAATFNSKVTADALTLNGGGLISSDGTSDTLVISGSNAVNTGGNITLEGNAASDASQIKFKNGSTTMLILGGGTIQTPTPGTSNVRLGVNTGNSIVSGANENVLIGDEAGTALISGGINNTAVGFSALKSEDGNGNNTAIGWSTLKNLNAGAEGKNTAVGSDSGRNMGTGVNNTLVGFESGHDISDGTGNTFLGVQAGDKTDDGANNVAVGFGAGGGNCGNNNVFVGEGAAPDGTGGTNTVVGSGACGGASGTFSASGTTAMGRNAGLNIAGGANNICIGNGADVAASAQANGICIGVGITAAANDFSFGKASNVVTCDFDADATFERSSDLRLKTNVADATLGLDFINDLRPVTYKWKASGDLDANDAELAHLRTEDEDGNIINQMTTDVTMHGLIAQEVKTALDTANVSTFKGWDKDNFGVQTISREMYVIPLIKAVQELSTALDAALARIATLEG